jgi:hypothetical protein
MASSFEQHPDEIVKELTALDRILHRLSSTTAANLSAVLTSLLPKLIPMVNNAVLRSKVVQVLSEAMRLTKLQNEVHISLSVLSPLLCRAQLPVAVNFALAFLDVLHDNHRLHSVDVATIAPLLESVQEFPLFSYQSNAILFYVLVFCEQSIGAAALIPNSKQIVTLLGDYFCDIILLNSDKDCVTPGLSDKRVSRLNLKRKFFLERSSQRNQLSIVKDRLLRTMAQSELFLCCCAPALLSALIAQSDNDQDRDCALAATWFLNRLNETSIGQQRMLQIFPDVLSMLFGFELTAIEDPTIVNQTAMANSHCHYVRNDRIHLKLDNICHGIDFLSSSIQLSVLFSLDCLVKDVSPQLLVDCFAQAVTFARTESGVNGIRVLSTMASLLEHWLKVVKQSQLHHDEEALYKLCVLCEDVIKQFTVTLTTSAASVAGIVDITNLSVVLREHIFGLLQILLNTSTTSVAKLPSLLLTLLRVADGDVLSTATPLFAILDSFPVEAIHFCGEFLISGI